LLPAQHTRLRKLGRHEQTMMQQMRTGLTLIAGTVLLAQYRASLMKSGITVWLHPMELGVL
jgi:hypothetical protein